MTRTIQINERGSMTIPKELRRRLGIEKGGVVTAETTEEGILLRPAVAYAIEIYSDKRVAEFDAAEAQLRRKLTRKKQA